MVVASQLVFVLRKLPAAEQPAPSSQVGPERLSLQLVGSLGRWSACGAQTLKIGGLGDG